MRNARNTAVASDRSATYSPCASMARVSSIEFGTACLLLSLKRAKSQRRGAENAEGAEKNIERIFPCAHLHRRIFTSDILVLLPLRTPRFLRLKGDSHLLPA